MNSVRRKLYMKHHLSGARDAELSYEVDAAAHAMAIRMSFLAVAHFQRFLTVVVPDDHGFEPWVDDDPVRQRGKARWNIVLAVGERRYRVMLFRQFPVAGQEQWALELYEDER